MVLGLGKKNFFLTIIAGMRKEDFGLRGEKRRETREAGSLQYRKEDP